MFEEELNTYKIFVSHISEEDEEYTRFIDKLNDSYDFQWENYSVPGKNLKDDIYKQIEPVDVVVILSGLYSKNSALIQMQMDVAMELEKPVVVIRPWGMEDVPGNLESMASGVVGWNTHCVVDNIRKSGPYDDYDEYDD
ncbi:TIR domain-containing protein [Methanobacterium aggregans]|uniref:TIR domain-containing protein n=1 Tax=Methanobacterium aggregans TaxID=1615586 RepID=UPI00320FEECA